MPSLGWMLRKEKNHYNTITVCPECFKDQQKRKILQLPTMLPALKGEHKQDKKTI